MEKEIQEHIDFLKQQLEQGKQRARLLEEIEEKLIEMRVIAEEILRNELSSFEKEAMNERFQLLQSEVIKLQKQLAPQMIH
ncbi:hypothetical protein RYX56_07880 [Alkalihalophilus lindianensis]|uniref:Uncharacterized protein n=1 Tax=Alkalihalophilus lindianensis TaxID=1630542 RepID=A0ABU3X8T9_9BACI|nr:hypothetical protein [Alkalihalophilus lindianensis]MDV2684285.1 hypothetical protein [Alkalihalophilus lindianensis]